MISFPVQAVMFRELSLVVLRAVFNADFVTFEWDFANEFVYHL